MRQMLSLARESYKRLDYPKQLALLQVQKFKYAIKPVLEVNNAGMINQASLLARGVVTPVLS